MYLFTHVSNAVRRKRAHVRFEHARVLVDSGPEKQSLVTFWSLPKTGSRAKQKAKQLNFILLTLILTFDCLIEMVLGGRFSCQSTSLEKNCSVWWLYYSLEDLARGAAVLVLPLLAHRARGHRIVGQPPGEAPTLCPRLRPQRDFWSRGHFSSHFTSDHGRTNVWETRLAIQE